MPYELITDPKYNSYSLKHIEFGELWELYKIQQSSFWMAEEIDFTKDYDDFIKLNKDEQHVIKLILAFFSNFDFIVNLNIDKNLISKITINEAKITYQFQVAMENIHAETYALMIKNIIKDNDERNYLFDSIYNIPTIAKIKDFCFKYIDSDLSLAHKIVAFAFVEGVLFSGAFAIIYYFNHYKSKDKKCMDGLVKSNEFIARDEGNHSLFAVKLYKLLINKLSYDEIMEIFNEGIEISKEFVNEMLKCNLIGLNSNLMNKYIEYVSDILIVNLGYKKIYNSHNPFSFMETSGLQTKSNFHEGRVTEYTTSHSIISNLNLNDNNDDF
jgi:ribonucleoside-diphosphate reductase beta chain